MALRGKKPETIEKRLKMLLYGKPGVGKTTAAIQFPRPYLIDTERGAENDQYVNLLKASGGAYLFTNDPSELIKEVQELLSTKHDYRTLIIDPLTTVYNDMLDSSAKRIARAERREEDDKEVTAFGRHKQMPDRMVKHLLNLLLRLDMNVIITSHAKGEWSNGAPTGKDTFDCYGKLEYLFDLSVEVQLRGADRVGVVRKSRIDSLPLGDTFPFSYDEIATRYGRDILERDAKPQTLATAEQIDEMKRLVELMKVEPETTDKWLEKAEAENWSEMPTETIEKCINFLKNQAAKGAA